MKWGQFNSWRGQATQRLWKDQIPTRSGLAERPSLVAHEYGLQTHPFGGGMTYPVNHQPKEFTYAAQFMSATTLFALASVLKSQFK